MVGSCSSAGITINNANIADKTFTVSKTSTTETLILGTDYYSSMTGCTFTTLVFSLLNSDGSTYNQSPALITIDASTGDVTFDRVKVCDYDIKIKIVADGSN